MRKRSALFFLILVLTSSVILLVAAQYGEDSTSLGQFVDEFTDLNNVSVTVDVVRNSTYNAMELNISGGTTKQYENFTAYTQVEPDNRVDVINDTHVAHRAERDEDSYLYFDYGVDYFDNFTHQFVWESDFAELTGIGFVWMISDIADDAKGIDDANGNYLGLQTYRDGAGRRLVLREVDSGTIFQTNWQAGPLANTLYYTNVSKYGTDLTVKIYDDPGMTNLVRTMSLTLQTDHKLEYIIPVNTYNSGLNKFSNSDVYNLWIGRTDGGYVDDGYFTTENYLDQVNGSTLAFMTQTRIFPGTHITVQFSDDNATWGDAEGVPGDSHDLLGGLETIDLRPLNESGSFYVMVNETTSDPAVTPYFNQSRLITTEGETPPPGAPGQNVTGVWEYFNASEIGVTTGTLDSGGLVNISTVDGTRMNISEVVGVPGMDISFNFTGIPTDASCVWLVLNSLYDGNQAHEFCIDLWNYTGSSWETIGHIPDQTAFEWINSTIYDLRIPADYVNATGEVRGRLYHLSAGNINHDLSIEFLNIYAEVPSTVTPSVGGEVDVSIFIALAIILSLIAYLLTRAER